VIDLLTAVGLRWSFSCAEVVRLSSGDSHKFWLSVSRWRWRTSLNTSLPSRIVPDPYRIGWLHAIDTFPSTALLPSSILKEEDLRSVSAAVTVRELFNEKDAPSRQLDSPSTRSARRPAQACWPFLAILSMISVEGMENSEPFPFPAQMMRARTGTAAPVLLLPSPTLDDRPQSLKLFARSALCKRGRHFGRRCAACVLRSWLIVVSIGLIFTSALPRLHPKPVFPDEFFPTSSA